MIFLNEWDKACFLLITSQGIKRGDGSVRSENQSDLDSLAHSCPEVNSKDTGLVRACEQEERHPG